MNRLKNLAKKILKSRYGKFSVYNKITIDVEAIKNNVVLLESLTSEKNIIPVLKSNAYGHGISEIASALKYKKFPYIAVDGYFEAQKIHKISRQPVLVMGAIRPENYSLIKTRHFAFVVHDEQSIIAMGKSGKKYKVHLEIDTGMSRHGIKSNEVGKFVKLIKSYPNILLEGVMSHLADADNPNNDYTNTQTRIFDKCVKEIISYDLNLKWIHIAQSAGSAKVISKYANVIRVGIALYGVNPLQKNDAEYKKFSELKPVLELSSTITKIVQIKAGVTVSYGRTYTAHKPTRVAILPIGYYEGVPRLLSDDGFVEVGEKNCKIIGRVNMNHIMIDVTDVFAQVGDKAVLVSKNSTSSVSLQSISDRHKLFSYSFLTGLSSTIRRTLINGHEKH